MESLFYKMIYDNHLKRSMKILEILHEEKHTITIKKLEEHLGVSRKTVFVTLEFVKTLLPEKIYLSISNNEVELHNAGTETIEKSLIEVAQKTSSFQILEHAFLNKGLTIHELSEKLFMSVSALRARIQHINKVLHTFDCSLSLYNLQFIGDEANIRYFGYTYFSEFQELYLFACKEQIPYCANVYENIIKRMQEEGSIVINHSYQQIIRLLLVTRDRVATGKIIKIEDSFIERINKRESYQEFRNIYKTELSVNLGGIAIPEAEIVWAYVASFSSIVYLLGKGKLFYWDTDDIQDYKKNIIPFLEEMASKLNIQAGETKEAFIYIHTAYLVNLILLTEITPVFQIGSYTVKKYVLENLGNLHAIWNKTLSKWASNGLFPLHNINSVGVQLTMISSLVSLSTKGSSHKDIIFF